MSTSYGLELSDEEQAFAEAIDTFCLRECPPDRLREWTQQGTVRQSPELYRRLADTGWLGVGIPEEFGGAGGGLRDVAILIERLYYHRLPVTGVLTTVITEQSLLKFGSAQQKSEILPAVAEGAILSIAITEPEAGSDVAGLQTVAVPEGDGWRMRGQKLYTTNANHADWVLVAARTSSPERRHDGITVFCVPMSREGVSFTPLAMLGHSDTNITYYDDVRVDRSDIVGEFDDGWTVLTRGLNSERVIVAAMALGYAQRAFDDALAYSKTRFQFGEPIGAFQALQHGFADTATQLAASRLLTYHSASLIQSGHEAAAEASMAKLHATETAKAAALQGLQYMGAIAYSLDSEMQAHVRDSLIMTVFGGTSEIQRNIIARQLGLPSSRRREKANAS